MTTYQRVSYVPMAAAQYLLALLLLACGGASSPPPETAVSVPVVATEPAPQPPAIPQDLWQLVPNNAMAVVEVDLTRLRQWSHYPTLRRWLTQYACVQDGAWTDLMDRVELGVGAVGVIDGRNQDGLLLLRGTFTKEDAAWIATEIDSNVTQQQRGRWNVHVGQEGMSVLLDERTLLVAMGTWRDASLNLANGVDTNSVRSAAFVQELTPRVAADGSLLTAMAAPSGEFAREVLRELGGWGGSAGAIAKGLAAAPYWGARANLGADNAALSVFGVAAGGSAANATALVDAMSSAFWQAGLFMRLIGLPPILSTANVQQDEGIVSLGLQATGGDGATLLARLEDAVKGAAHACTPAPTIATSPTP